MLVLSRKENERLLFPSLGMSIEVMRVQGRKIRLGIDASEDVVVLREEIADLKGIEITPGPESDARKLSQVSAAATECVQDAATMLNQMHQHCEGDAPAQQMILDLFSRFRQMQQQMDAVLGEESPAIGMHGLLIDGNQDERELLSSCLRMGGFEITEAADRDDAMDFLSLHACPDFILCEGDIAGSDLVTRLRGFDPVGAVRLYSIGQPIPGVDHVFSRPLCAEAMMRQIQTQHANAA